MVEADGPAEGPARDASTGPRPAAPAAGDLAYRLDDGDPQVTVIMPIRNEAGFIARSLGAVLAQDYPAGHLEVVIADGGSTDTTRSVVLERAAAHPAVSVRIVDNPRGIVPTGMNAAIAVARGQVIVRVDGHTIIEPDYVRECIGALRRSGAHNVGGRMDPVGEGPFGRAVAAATMSPFGVGGARFHYSQREEEVDTVYMGTWPAVVLHRLGGFDEEMVRNQDDELNYRLRSRGGRVWLTPRIRSRYYNRATVRSLWRQYFQYGYWKVRVMQKQPGQMSLRHFVPATFVLGVSLALLAAPRLAAGRVALAALLVPYGLANLVASVQAARRAPDASPALVALAFAALHGAYGAGFLVGLARFAGYWSHPRSRP